MGILFIVVLTVREVSGAKKKKMLCPPVGVWRAKLCHHFQMQKQSLGSSSRREGQGALGTFPIGEAPQGRAGVIRP
jgi:hypothetical protein